MKVVPGFAVLICFAGPPACFSACKRAVPTTIHHGDARLPLNAAPKTIEDLASAIQGKSRAQIREIMADRFGPSRHEGSGIDIEVWDVAGGRLVFHPIAGPSFEQGRGRIWLLKTTNEALSNIFGRFEVLSPTDRRGMRDSLGDVSLNPNHRYAFQDSGESPGKWAGQAGNFFMLHPSGGFAIEFADGCTGETLLESLRDKTILGRLIFTPGDGAQTATYSISIEMEHREIVIRAGRAPSVRIRKSWRELWR